MMRVFWLGQRILASAMAGQDGAAARIDEQWEFADTEGLPIGEIRDWVQEQ